MYKMIIKLNESQLIADGIGSKSDNLLEIINEIDSYEIERIYTGTDGNIEYMIATDSFGDESYLISVLEEIPWFMKYVLIWKTDDNGYISDMIEVERKTGQKCSYAL